MRNIRKLGRRVYFLLHRDRLERELTEEMEIHREMMPPDNSSHFGSATRLREESREAWSWMWLERLWQDLSYGARVLWRARGFTLGAVAVLALGVGVNLAEFQIFDAAIFHRITVPDINVLVQFTRASKEGARLGFPPAAVEFYRAESSSFAWLISEDTSISVVVDGDAAGQRSSLVSSNYFGSLRILPAWGRLLDERDSQPGAPAVAVLGYDYWQSHWGGDPQVVGRTVHVNNKAVQVVGVAPYTFEGLSPRRTAVWLPAAIRPLLVAGSPPIQQDYSRDAAALFGELKAGVSRAAGDAELTSLTRELIRRQPRAFRADEQIQGNLVQDSLSRTAGRSPAVAIFVVMVLLVLFSACANLGNMLLARGLARQREIDIRLAIGASRTRIVRQLMTENFLLAVLGTIAGMGFGAIAARVLLNALNAPRNIQLQVSWPILVAGVVVTFFSAAAFGLPAALQTVQTVRRNHRKLHLRQSLVGVQVAVSCLLLIASAVLAHHGILSSSIDLKFDYANMIVIDPQLFARHLPVAVALQKLDALTTQLSALPGVDGVTATVIPPLSGRIRLDSLPGLPRVYRNAVAPSYFSVMALPMVRGRTFLPGEQNAVIVSESAARAVWPNEDPVGKVWNFAGAARTVTGVVKDSGANILADPDSIEAYTPIYGTDVEGSALILHSRSDPALLLRLISNAGGASDDALSMSLMRASRDNFLAAMSRLTTLIGSIGVVATALAAAGMFALVAFTVAQRKRELGIRIAIGGRPRHVLGVLLSQNVRPTAIGIVAGTILAVILTRLVRSFIALQFGDGVDVTGFSAGLACFALVAILATLSPARRALRIDPAATLREE